MPPTPITTLPHLPARDPHGHKGDYGTALIVAGGRGMGGAAILCTSAALRGGTGLVRAAIPASLALAVTTAQPCALTLPLPETDGFLGSAGIDELLEAAHTASVVACGPGLGKHAETATLVHRLVRELARPLVLDADALNLLGANPAILRERPGPTVLTPHPGEFGRLRGTASPKVAERDAWATAFAADYGMILVLKGAGTLVTDGTRLYRNATGNPGMATGGTGDVLTGLLAALIAQRMEPFDAACLAVHLHGRAGDLARDVLGEPSLIASDLLDYLPAAFRSAGP